MNSNAPHHVNPEHRPGPRKLLRRILRCARHQWSRRIRKRILFLALDIRKGPCYLPELHLMSVYNRLRRLGHRPTLLTLPGRPGGYRGSLVKTLLAMGWRVTQDPDSRFDVALLWENKTEIEPPSVIEQLRRSGAVRVINGRCLDIRKSHVARVFGDTFGYSMELDPTRHRGRCVSKPEINALHEGLIVETPIENPDPGRVYHRLINNVVDQDQILDLRTHIEDGVVRLVVRKYRRVDLRFRGAPNLRAELSDPQTEFKAGELTAIAEFCRRIGIDHGTLDILRDADDGRIYIVDANKTPWGPAVALAPREHRTACRVLARAFEEAYLRRDRDSETSDSTA